MLLVTGSTGLLGGHLLYALLQTEDRVAALKRPSSSTETLREILSFYTRDPDPLLDRIDWRTGDLLDKHSLVQALAGINCVINCAAVVSFDQKDQGRMIASNVLGTRNLAEAIWERAGDGRQKTEDFETWRREDGETLRREEGEILLIQISSIAALGDGPGDDPKFLISEETPRDPSRQHSGYSYSKFESEKVIRETGIPSVILNPGVILGPGQWDKGSSQLFVKAWQGLKYYPYGGTGYVDVRDVAAIVTEICLSSPNLKVSKSHSLKVSQSSVFRLLSSPIGERFCLVGANLRYREFFNLVTDESGKPNPAVYAGRLLTGLAWRADAVGSFLMGRPRLLTRETVRAAQRISSYSSDKIIKTLDFRFRPVEETVEWMAECFKKTRRDA